MSEDPNPGWGLAAVGSGGDITLELLYRGGSEERWRCELRLRKVSVTFTVVGEDSVRRLHDFVARHLGRARFEEEKIGTFHQSAVFIVKDDEFPDRLYLRARGGDPGFEIIFVDAESEALLAALKSLVSDLASPS